MTNSIVPIANFKKSKLQFVTCDLSHLRILQKFKRYKGSAGFDRRENILRNFFYYLKKSNNIDNYKYCLETIISLINLDPTIIKFCTIKKRNIRVEFLHNISLTEYRFLDTWIKPHDKQSQYQFYYIITAEPQLLSYLKQQSIDYFQSKKLDQEISGLLQYLEHIFSETNENKKLVEQELDDLMSICLGTLDRKNL